MTGAGKVLRRRPPVSVSSPCEASLLPVSPDDGSRDQVMQAANSLCLSAFDRRCIAYLQDSILVVILGKHWPWSTLSYAYHRVAVKEPMVMSMMLASTAREIYRSQIYEQGDVPGQSVGDDSPDTDGSVHYGRALAGLREALKQDVKSPQKIEGIFITLWLMIDYENRFGSGASAINIHIRGVESLLHNHIVPLLKHQAASASRIEASLADSSPKSSYPSQAFLNASSASLASSSRPLDELRCTSVPLFLLWTLYFFTPGALFFGSGMSRLDTDILQFFLRSEPDNPAPLSLPELYRISRQSPSRFWGDEYPVSAQLDDQENLPGLTLYHRSHVVQFKITELCKHRVAPNSVSTEDSYQWIINEINALALEFDTVLTLAKSSPSCEVTDDGRRVMETIYWSSITYYSTIVYFHLCFRETLSESSNEQSDAQILPLNNAVSQVLGLSLKLHHSRPRLMVRITWPLFIAGIATSDRIYQDWVSIRLRELGRYGQNYTRISRRFDEVIRCGDPDIWKGDSPLCLGG
ncbi:hypothetical protein NUU61_007769 [Penicillium alfredii]|uniref:Transcription factor domain-containing protein n=1 Tax=Penicillium alfredii TaxID=1506179 RepID=A0A9W9JZB4_9EURO|nr:uncharacterized protein NUU61_007769 [Penicillium alfredii]KAJ5086462.1 hypothetical protein NUU61_007769 [Penicillium alfredii]